MLEWSDPERAAQLIDAAQPLTQDGTPEEIDMLEIRGMIYADGGRDQDVDAVVRRLDAIARDGATAAVRAGNFVRAYAARQHDQFAAAEAELRRIDLNSISSDAERYRVLILRGYVDRILGQDEAALPFLEHAVDLANKMHHELRTLHAMLALARLYTDSGNYDRAMISIGCGPAPGHPAGRRSGLGGNRGAGRRHRRPPRRPRRGTARVARGTRARETFRKQQMAGARPC